MTLYSLFNTIGMVMVLVYNLLHFKEKQPLLGGVSRSAINYFEQRKQCRVCKLLAAAGFWTILEILVITVVQYYFVGLFNTAFGKLVNTGANYFGLMTCSPVLVLLFCLLLKIDPLAQMDLITPAYPLGLIFVKIACYAANCCRGVAWIDVFPEPIIIPVQLMESAAALLLFVFLIRNKRKMKKGTVFPVYLMTYSGLRFFTEFFRCEPKVFMGLRTYQLLCLAGIVVGALEYAAVCRYRARKMEKANLKDLENVHVTENNHF